MKKILIVIDMQKDFIDGALGTAEAVSIVPAIREKMLTYPTKNIYATRDTHPADYLQTQEGRNLPVPHCIQGTIGWEIDATLRERIPADHIFDKPTFGSVELAETMRKLNDEEPIAIELCGLCTDICVISNALMLKAFMPEIPISVDAACTAGVTPEKYAAALETMRSCQITIL